MSAARQERADAAAAILEEARKMAAKANGLATWANRVLQSAEEEALWAARRATTRMTLGDIRESTAKRPIRKAIRGPRTRPLDTTTSCDSPTAAQKVFGITENLEAILLCDSITVRKLFSLQCVSKHFADTIAGSLQLQKKMFLRPVNRNEAEYSALNPLFDDPRQRLRFFDNIDFEGYDASTASSGPRVLVRLDLYGGDTQHIGRGHTRETLRYFAGGDFVLPGTWQKTHVVHEASETFVDMDTEGDLEDGKSAPSGKTMGAFMRSLSLFSTWSLADYFKSVNERLEDL